MARERKCRENNTETSVLPSVPSLGPGRAGGRPRAWQLSSSLSLSALARAALDHHARPSSRPRARLGLARQKEATPRDRSLPFRRAHSEVRPRSREERASAFATCRHQQPVICPHGNCPCHQRTLASRRPRPSDNKRRNEVGQGSDPLVMRLVASQRVVARPCSHHPARSCRLVVPALKDGA